MRKTSRVIAILTFVFLASIVCIAKEMGRSPNGNLCLVLDELADHNRPRLNLVDSRTSKTITSAQLDASPINKLQPVWSNRNDAVAVAVDYTTTKSQVIGFLRLTDGQFKPLIFGGRGSLGKFGERDEHWKKIRNFPVAWDTMSNPYDYRFVDIKTQVWDKSGQRYTAMESVGITTGGLITGR